MINNNAIVRKFLVHQADLQGLNDLQLSRIHTIYLDLTNLSPESLLHDGYPVNAEVVDMPFEVELHELTLSDGTTSHFWLSRVGRSGIIQAENVEEIDLNTFSRAKESRGVRELKKSRFSFTYLRKFFDLDIVNSKNTMILNARLENEREFFALPPFVILAKDVTEDPNYDYYSLSNPIKDI